MIERHHAGRVYRGGRARVHRFPVRRSPAGFMLAPPSGVGFSLKPPKKVRKILHTIKKNVTLKRALIVGAVVAAPFALPAIAHGAAAAGGLLARGAGAAGRFIGREAAAFGRGVARRFPVSTPGATPSDSPYNVPGDPGATAVPQAATVPAPVAQDSGGGGYSGGGGGSPNVAAPADASPDAGAQTAGPAPGGSIAPLAIGTVVILALVAAAKKPRRAA